MKKTNKRSLRVAMFMIAIMGAVNITLADDITVGDVSNTDCPRMTRAEGVAGHTILKLTRSETGLVGELRYYQINCGYGDVKVLCEEDGDNLTIVIDDDAGEHMMDCTCPINIYFSLFNVMKDEFQLKVRGRSERNVGTISLKGHTMVEIDLATLVILYDESFEYHLKAQNFRASITDFVTPKDVSQQLLISHESEPVFVCSYKNYVLPLDYSYLDVNATLDDDSTLVINVQTDGIPDKDGKRIGELFFNIVSTFRDAYHLKVNNTILYGSENEQTTCIYEGDITVPLSEQVTIPLAPTSTGFYKEPLWYYVDLYSKTACVQSLDTYKSLSNIVIPPSVELWGINCTVDKIGDYAFKGMTNLKSIVIPESVREIGQDAFSGCTGLTSITIPESVREIGQGAFSGCTSLTAIPEGMREIGQGVFNGCTGLTAIIIPEGVREIGEEAFKNCTGLASISLPSSLVSLGRASFLGCNGLTSVTLPEGLTSIGRFAFESCLNLKVVDIPASITSIDNFAFRYCENLVDVYCRATKPPYTTGGRQFLNANPEAILHVPAASLQVYKETAPWRDFKYIVPIKEETLYRPFIEGGKVWKVGAEGSGNPVQWVEYYYLDGDTIVDGRTCKQMMHQRYVSPDHPDLNMFSQLPFLSYVGAWYEEDKKVYTYDETNKQFMLMYDFSLEDNGIFQENGLSYVIGPRQTGGIKGFKGVHREVWEYVDGENTFRCAPWLEGVGGVYGPPTTNVFNVELAAPLWFLMSCTVGDEVIYFNDGYEDGATPEEMNARKQRIDFTHTIKIRPKARREEAEPSLYGEYNALQLGINLNPLDDAYLVCITDESGKTVYEKTVNAGNIVGLNIDISAYAEGRYTVTVENDEESFTGEFEAQTTGISEAERLNDNGEMINDNIYNLQGQRISTPRKGLNIVRSAEGRLQGKNGRKVFVK